MRQPSKGEKPSQAGPVWAYSSTPRWRASRICSKVSGVVACWMYMRAPSCSAT